MNIDVTVKKETRYITQWVIILSVLLQAVFLLSGYWDWKALTGNLLGGVAAVLNFLLLGITIQNAVKKTEDHAKKFMKISHTYRNLMLLAMVVLGIALPCFNTLSVIIPLFFPRIAIAFRPLADKKGK